jgi:hypothetical protein
MLEVKTTSLNAIEGQITSIVKSLLGPVEIASDSPLMDAGIDSLAAAELGGLISS